MNKELVTDRDQQLKEFKCNKADLKRYARFSPKREKALVRIFKFTPSDKTVLGKSKILTVSPLDGTLKPNLVAQHEKFLPIIRVIKTGDECPDWIKDGELYTVPFNDVVGEKWNPEFQWMMQNFSQKRGDGKPSMVTIPEDMKQKLLSVDVNWERYKFAMPDAVEEGGEDEMVYLIPSLKIEAA